MFKGIDMGLGDIMAINVLKKHIVTYFGFPVWVQFVHNIQEYKGLEEGFRRVLMYIKQNCSEYIFDCAFNWSLTPQGNEYWRTISNRWNVLADDSFYDDIRDKICDYR